MTILATLHTDVIEKHDLGKPLEGGQFDVPVDLSIELMEKSGSPRKFFFHEIAIHLAQGIQDTGVPREFWYVRFSKEAQREFNMPESTRCTA